ncbi:MAG TPA: hypothetical protein P5223_14785 [Phycisphaerae bacterium]|nr:hypothetical protein [Phycisphaerae bacterium]
MSNRSQYYISLIRTANRQIWDALNTLVAAQREWNALDYGTTLPAGEGAHEGITKTMVGAVTFDTANALVTTLNAGHATNMAKLL